MEKMPEMTGSKSAVKKNIIIVAVWLISLTAAIFLYAKVEKRRYTRKAEKELVQEARTLAEMIPTFVQNNYASNNCLLNMQNAKLNALSLALEQAGNVDEAREIVEEFMKVCEISSLAIYDKDGSVIYDSGDPVLREMDFETMRAAAESDYFSKAIESEESVPKSLMSYAMSSEAYREESQVIVRPVNDGQWILASGNIFTEEEEKISTEYDWRNVISGIRVGNAGTLIVADREDGTILSCGNWEESAGPGTGSGGKAGDLFPE